jgi:hypothetical protein
MASSGAYRKVPFIRAFAISTRQLLPADAAL